jgi:hypothetical protein
VKWEVGMEILIIVIVIAAVVFFVKASAKQNMKNGPNTGRKID